MSNNTNGKTGLGLGPKTVKNIRGYLSMALNYGVREELIPSNPATNIKLPRVGKPRVGCFTYSEMQAFVSVKDNYEYGDALAFDLFTGLRPEELFALTEDDIDFERYKLRIERACIWIEARFIGFGAPKSENSARTIDITEAQAKFLLKRIRIQEAEAKRRQCLGLPFGEPAVERWIERERRAKAYLYPSKKLIFSKADGQVPSDHVTRRCFKAMLRGAGFKDERLKLRFYDLRHTHASYLLMLGVPPVKVAERLGHTVGVLHYFYQHVIPDLLLRTPSEVFAEKVAITW